MEQDGAVIDGIVVGGESLAGDRDVCWLEARLNENDGVGVGDASRSEGQLMWSGAEIAHLAGCDDDARGGGCRFVVVQIEEQGARCGRDGD